jgi:hypothetical protein
MLRGRALGAVGRRAGRLRAAQAWEARSEEGLSGFAARTDPIGFRRPSLNFGARVRATRFARKPQRSEGVSFAGQELPVEYAPPKVGSTLKLPFGDADGGSCRPGRAP